jgi:uncharacterized membrane protein
VAWVATVREDAPLDNRATENSSVTDAGTATVHQQGRNGSRGETQRQRLAPWHWTGHQRGVAGLTALFAVFYGVFSCTIYFTHRVGAAGTYDLGIFDQGIRSYAHFQPGTTIAKGLHNFGVADFSILGDHFSPIDALLAPLYWIYDSPVDLVIAQGVLFALAIPPIWAFTRREFGGGRAGAVAGYAVAVAYGLSWPIASAAAFPFHEAAWAPLLMAVALERLQKKRLRGALVALGLLLVVKEDMGLFVAGLGLGLIFARWPGLARQRLVGLGLFVVGLVYTFTAVWVFIPAMGGQSYYYWAYSELGQNVPQAVKHILTHPLGSAKLLITPHVKVRTTLELFGPFFFLALLSPIVLAAAPLLLERMLANTAGAWWVTGFQYNSFVIVPIALAAVQGASRLQGGAGRILGSSRVRAALARVRLRHLAGATTWAAGKIAVGFTLLFALFSIALVRQFAFDPMFHVSFYQRTATATAEVAAAVHVPSGVVVAAVNDVGPHLDSRDTVLLWDGDGKTPVFTPWVVANVTQRQFTFDSVKEQVQRVARLRAHGYITVFQDDGVIVLHAPGAAGANAAAYSKVFLKDPYRQAPPRVRSSSTRPPDRPAG